MPELPEVETTKNSLVPLIGQAVQQVQVVQSSLRWPVPHNLKQLTGQRLIQLKRRAKYIIAEFSQDQLLIHLGMSGSLRLCQPNDMHRKHDHVLIDFETEQLRYHDPRRFGCIIWHDADDTKLDHLGVEPLSDRFNPDYLYQRLQNKRCAIKTALMDQAIVVGVGNIYATESLFKAGIHPNRPAHLIQINELSCLVQHVKTILTHAIELGGSTLKDYTNALGENGYFQQTLLAYGRAGELCHQCGCTLENLRISQRSSVYCPQCQPQ